MQNQSQTDLSATHRPKIVIIGCTHAGVAAIKEILKYYPHADITVYERHATISYLSCGTYLHLGGVVPDLDQVFYADPATFSDQGVTMRMQYDVIEVNARTHSLLVQDLRTRELRNDHYDRLIMATGSLTKLPAIAGIENPKILLCKTCDEAARLFAAAQHSHRIAIVGGGYAGVELAEGYRRSGHAVTLIQKAGSLLNDYLDEPMAKRVKTLLTDQQVTVMTGTTVQRFDDTADDAIRVTTTNGNVVVDMVTVCPGAVPHSDLLDGQVDLATNGAIITDPYMGSSDPDIFAAGDVAEVQNNVLQTKTYMPLASHAIRQGTLAGINVLDKRLRTIGTQSTTGMLLFGQTIASVGLTLATAQANHFMAKWALYTGHYRPDFMPGESHVAIELIYDPYTRRVLGGQLISDYDVSQSANTLSVIIQNESTIDQLAFVDMLFSPNFNEPFNFLNRVAQVAVDQEHGYARS